MFPLIGSQLHNLTAATFQCIGNPQPLTVLLFEAKAASDAFSGHVQRTVHIGTSKFVPKPTTFRDNFCEVVEISKRIAPCWLNQCWKGDETLLRDRRFRFGASIIDF